MKRHPYPLLAVGLVALAAGTAAAQSMAQPTTPPPPAPPAQVQSPGQAGLPTYLYYVNPAVTRRHHRVYRVAPFPYDPWYYGYNGWYAPSGQYWYAYYPTPYSSTPVVVRYFYGPGYAYYYYYVPPQMISTSPQPTQATTNR